MSILRFKEVQRVFVSMQYSKLFKLQHVTVLKKILISYTITYNINKMKNCKIILKIVKLKCLQHEKKKFVLFVRQ